MGDSDQINEETRILEETLRLEAGAVQAVTNRAILIREIRNTQEMRRTARDQLQFIRQSEANLTREMEERQTEADKQFALIDRRRELKRQMFTRMAESQDASRAYLATRRAELAHKVSERDQLKLELDAVEAEGRHEIEEGERRLEGLRREYHRLMDIVEAGR